MKITFKKKCIKIIDIDNTKKKLELVKFDVL